MQIVVWFTNCHNATIRNAKLSFLIWRNVFYSVMLCFPLYAARRFCATRYTVMIDSQLI